MLSIRAALAMIPVVPEQKPFSQINARIRAVLGEAQTQRKASYKSAPLKWPETHIVSPLSSQLKWKHHTHR